LWYKFSLPTIRTGDWGNVPNAGVPDAGVAFCKPDEMVISGGGQCSDPTRAWVHDSFPMQAGSNLDGFVFATDGWYANCFGRDTVNWSITKDTVARAYAVCLKKQ
jgi:hypothetical protein